MGKQKNRNREDKWRHSFPFNLLIFNNQIRLNNIHITYSEIYLHRCYRYIKMAFIMKSNITKAY